MNWILALIELEICLFKLLRKFNLLNKKFKLCGRLTPPPPPPNKKKTLIYPHTIYKHSKRKDQTFLKYVVLTSHYCSMLYIFNKRNFMYNIEDKVHYCKVTQNGTSHYQWITWMFQWGGIINEKILYYIKYKTKGKNWKQKSTDIALLPWPLSQPIVFYLFQYSSK